MSRFGSNFRSRRRTARAFGTTAHADGAPAPVANSRPTATDWMNSAANVFTSVGSLFTGWGTARGNQPAGPGQTVVIPSAQQQNSTALWVGVIVVAAVVGGILWWIVKKKK